MPYFPLLQNFHGFRNANPDFTLHAINRRVTLGCFKTLSLWRLRNSGTWIERSFGGAWGWMVVDDGLFGAYHDLLTWWLEWVNGWKRVFCGRLCSKFCDVWLNPYQPWRAHEWRMDDFDFAWNAAVNSTESHSDSPVTGACDRHEGMHGRFPDKLVRGHRGWVFDHHTIFICVPMLKGLAFLMLLLINWPFSDIGDFTGLLRWIARFDTNECLSRRLLKRPFGIHTNRTCTMGIRQCQQSTSRLRWLRIWDIRPRSIGGHSAFLSTKWLCVIFLFSTLSPPLFRYSRLYSFNFLFSTRHFGRHLALHYSTFNSLNMSRPSLKLSSDDFRSYNFNFLSFWLMSFHVFISLTFSSMSLASKPFTC